MVEKWKVEEKERKKLLSDHYLRIMESMVATLIEKKLRAHLKKFKII